MSLQVWLPLNGDLINRGCSDLTFSPVLYTSTVVETGGKIGSCYHNFSTIQYNEGGIISDKKINLGLQQSMFCWFKYNDLVHSSTLGAGLVSQHRYQNCTGMGITIAGRSSSDQTGLLSVNTGNGVSRTYATYCGTTVLKSSTWYHGGYTFDGTTIRIYVNGVCEKEQECINMEVPADYLMLFAWSLDTTSNPTIYAGYKLNGYMNDVRIYDHCLSPAEVRELACGLVCHYRLSDFLSSSNLIVNGYGDLGSENWSSSSNISTTEIPSGHSEIKASMFTGNRTGSYIPMMKNHSYTISGYVKAISGASGTAYPSIMPYDIDKKFIANYHTSDGFGSAYQTTLARPLKKGDTVIYATSLSSWTTATNNYYYHVAIFGYKDSRGNVYPNMVYTQDSPVFGTYSDKSHINKTNNTITLNAAFTGEDRPAGTVICQATEGSTYYYPWGGVSVSSVSSWTPKSATFKPANSGRLKAMAYMLWYVNTGLYIAGNKLVDNDAVDTMISDGSGFSNNGTRSSNVELSYDSPRYEMSTFFPENSSTITIKPFLNMGQVINELSVACWFKTSTLNNTAPNLWSLGENSFIRLRLGSTSQLYFYAKVGSNMLGYTHNAGKTLTDNTWHHTVLTFKNGVFNMYLDGVKLGTNDASGTSQYLTCGSVGSTWHLAGYTANAENFIGKLSDFRIYAGCLTADDVTRLYTVSASVCNNGSMIGYEMKEDL